MQVFRFIIVIICVTRISSRRVVRNTGSSNGCLTPLRENGYCVSLKHCPEVVNLFTALPQNRAKQYSTELQRRCGHQTTFDNYPVVCCTKVVTGNGLNDAPAESGTNTASTKQTTTTIRTPVVTEATTSDERIVGRTTPRSMPQSNTSCQGPDLIAGTCLALQNCDVLYNRLKNSQTDDAFKEFLRASNKACMSMNTDVCCPSSRSASTSVPQPATFSGEAPRRLPSEDDGCGLVVQNSPKVVGGQDSQIGAWPWIALIGYDAWSLNPFRCGGTLISTRHVITAAHCIRQDLSFVRLGEFDLSSDTDTRHVDIDVVKKLSHPDFRAGRNDVAILFLVNNVQITADLIAPICMPTSSYMRTKSYVGSNPFVAGWGRTTQGGTGSQILQELQLPVQENSVCRNSFEVNGRRFDEQQFDSSIVCAGTLVGGKDTCQGDSGGPLMIPELYKGITRYYLIGIVSYGIGCARVGIPGIYTSTRYFMDWITSQIAAS